MSNPLQDYEEQFPGLLDFYSRLLGHYFEACPIRYPQVAHRMALALESLGPELALKALGVFQQAGLFYGGPMVSRAQVDTFWSSPLMVCFQAAIGYQPSPQTDLREHIPEQVSSVIQLAQRCFALSQRARQGEVAQGSLTYWQAALQASCLELYLLPFIPEQEAQALRGLDLGAGWGRATLELHEIRNLSMCCVDISSEQLKLLEILARNIDFQGRIECFKSATEQLPLADESLDFAVTYGFLHLLEDEALTATLQEVLRCLKPNTPIHVELPTSSPLGVTMVTNLSVQELIDRFHSTTAHHKTFQLAAHDPRFSNLFTFAVLKSSDLPSQDRIGRKAFRHKPLAKRLLCHRKGFGLEQKASHASKIGS